ncbi:DUF1749 domain-containing protein [Candidatus Woesearchaeota archaeon]|nr:DUF1749 domain-containing protein [Candidatus Woesearchaeota archaeon]
MTEDGLEIEGLLCPYPKSKTCLVHVHGMTDNFVGLAVVDSLANAAYKNKMSFFTFNNRGMGTITVFQRLKEHLLFRTMGTSFEHFKDSIHDIHSALNVLRELGYSSFFLSGHSTGCQKITYYQYRKGARSVKGLILLAPADDYNFQIKKLGKRTFNEMLYISRRLVRLGKGRELMPYEAEPSYFSAKRYYELYHSGSIEGNLFNYESRMKAVSSIKVPILALFGQKEEFTAMPVRKMLRILQSKYKNPSSKTALVPHADHCFCRHEREVEVAVQKWMGKQEF